jgi:hypothetical protein
MTFIFTEIMEKDVEKNNLRLILYRKHQNRYIKI